jgi:hypothetical protein
MRIRPLRMQLRFPLFSGQRFVRLRTITLSYVRFAQQTIADPLMPTDRMSSGTFIYISCSCIRPPGIHLGMSWRVVIFISVYITDVFQILILDIQILANFEHKIMLF